METIVKFINYQPESYYWFFSALAQSLAALIGLSGVFIVYRLQIQENRISDAIKDLQKGLSDITTRDNFNMIRDATMDAVDKEINFREKKILQYKEELEKKPQDQYYLNEMKREERGIAVLKLKKQKVKNEEWYAKQIRYSALITIIYFIILFISSILGFLHTYTYAGIQRIVIFLIGGLVLLGLCCAVSLDFGRPALKELYDKFLIFIEDKK
jgi:hypothetical protein